MKTIHIGLPEIAIGISILNVILTVVLYLFSRRDTLTDRVQIAAIELLNQIDRALDDIKYRRIEPPTVINDDAFNGLKNALANKKAPNVDILSGYWNIYQTNVKIDKDCKEHLEQLRDFIHKSHLKKRG